MDPTGAEADLLARQTTVACMPGLGQITHLEHRGQGTVAATAAATRSCVAGCAARGQDLRRVLAQSLEAPLRRAVQEMSRSRE